jgi:dTDP-glucose 4,6-dehydratase
VRILLTGASGFVGHHVLDYLVQNTQHEIICPVSWEHRGIQQRWRALMGYALNPRVRVMRHDLRSPIDSVTSRDIGHIDAILNIASESHVDRSIEQPRSFVENNVALQMTMLEFARERRDDLRVFLQMSTDEVYGPADVGDHPEWSAILPSNPYSASKAAQEAVSISYWRTYDLPIVITNTMNIFGPRQDAEKFPAMVMRAISRGEVVNVHAQKGVNSPYGEVWNPGSRFYLPAYNLADAWTWLLANAPTWELRYVPDVKNRPVRLNIVGAEEVDNLRFAEMIGAAMGREVKTQFVDFHATRPGHDRRYALDGYRLSSLGYQFPWTLERGIEDMVRWYSTENGRLWNA